MPSRQDQLHSYQFMVQRVIGALVAREPDPAQSPMRRATNAGLAGVLVAAIALGVVAVYGVLTGGGAATWRDPSVVIVEKESGARYVYRDAALHPVLNYASALLIAGSTEPRTVLVSREAIAGVPRGLPLGITDAPESLPDARRLSERVWTVCSVPAMEQGRSEVRSVLLVGAEAGAGRALADDGLLLRHPDGSLYLVWHNHRHLVRDRRLVLTALGWTNQQPATAAPALLNALPAGADLTRITVPHHGQPSELVPAATIGEVFVVRSLSGERQYAVAMQRGLSGITQVQAALLLTMSGQDEPTELTQGSFADISRLPDLVPTGSEAMPATAPELASVPGGVVCGRARGEVGVDRVLVGARVPTVSGLSRTPADPGNEAASADYIVVEPGRGSVVEAVPAPGADGGTVCVVTDLGRRYPVANDEALAMLGYGDVQPFRIPASVVALVPAGAALDPAAARTPVVRP